MVRVRIAPSPTGFAHVGTAYASIFNYAFAKKKKGKFIVRIEDTDVKRNVKGAEEAIFNALKWLGLSWDEKSRQSDRLKTYQKKAQELVDQGLAYKDQGAIRLKNPGKEVSWQDLVRGKITFPGDQITDFVIQRSDGYPTYNFAVVVDDILMKITHVIRGEEHISNTPRQLVLYQAFKQKPPAFAHFPSLRNKEGKKLSKRRDPVDLRIYQDEGYLPQALVNYLCLLGWSHPQEKEIFNLAEFIKLFDLSRIRKAGPYFDKVKLDWLNGEYIRQTPDAKLKTLIYDFYKKKYNQEKIKMIVPLIKERIKKLNEFETLAGFFFEAPQVPKKLLGKNSKKHLQAAVQALEKGTALEKVPEKNNFSTGEFFMDLRLAVTGSRVTPPINESIEILGKEEAIKRIKKAI